MKKSQKYIKPSIAVLILLSLMFSLPALPGLAFNEGPNNPGVAVNVSTIGTEPWVEPGNITLPGSPYASVALYHLHLTSNYLQATQYGFAIPADATVMGIEVVVNRMASGRNPSLHDNVLSLVKAGAVVGDNKALADPWPITLTPVTYGGPTDLWGTTWTSEEVNAPDFGAALSTYRDNNGNNERFAVVDSIQVTVYYVDASATTVDCGAGLPVMTYGESITCVATVTSVTINRTPSGAVSWASDGSGTFDPVSCTLAGANGTATCSVTYTPSAVGNGSHLVTADYAGDDYLSPSSASQAVVVNPRPVTVTADAQSKLYGEADPELTYQITDGSLVFSDTFTGSLTRAAGELVGTYPILQGTLALSPNYDLTYVGNNLTINPRPVTVTADPQAKFFGDPDPEFTYQLTSGSLVFSDTFTGSLIRAAGELVGTYPILQGSLALSPNYDLTYVGSELTINPLQATVTADAQSKVYGEADPALTYQVTQGTVLPGSLFTGSLERVPGENVGTYAITLGTLALPNYELTFVSNTLSITPRPVTVTADPQAKFIGLPDPQLTYQVTSGSLAFNDQFTGALTRMPGESKGTYAILQGSLALSANYDLTYVGNFLTIPGARFWLPMVTR